MNLSTEEKQKLLMGNGAWNTCSIENKVSAITMNDGPHGLRKPHSNNMAQINDSEPATCFPCEASLANSWNTELAEKMGSQIAKEAKSYGTSIILGCGANIKRSPLCGRNFEYLSEDPLLAGEMAASYITGAQKNGTGTSLKHFAGNNQENCRMVSNSQIDERALREIYLRPFEIAVKKGNPATIMASYNYLNGIHATENHELLTDILRNEWKYQGAVVSDWGACTDPVKSHEAGMDLEMPENPNHINPNVSEPELTKCAENVAALSLKFNNNNCKSENKEELFAQSKKLAEEIQCESIVLLKNNGILPLPSRQVTESGETPQELFIIGQLAKNMRFQGGGSSHINATSLPDAVTAFSHKGYNVRYYQGYNNNSEKPDKNLEDEVFTNIDETTPIVFFGGLPEKFEGEGYDRDSLKIPQNQIQLFEKICKKRKNIIFINTSGSAVDIAFADKADAILHTALGGQAADTALVKVFSGEENPSGKLSETFPFRLEDTPCYNYFGTDCDIEYRESLFVGYRFYQTFSRPVSYCFGHGLSYTSFTYYNASITQEGVSTSNLNMNNSQKPELEFFIKNTGLIPGKEVCQVYIKNPKGNFIRPEIELAGFKKVSLDAGEEKKISISLDERAFSIWDISKHKFICVAGEYEIYIGSSSKDIRLALRVQIDGEETSLNQKNILTDYFNQDGDIFKIRREQFQTLYGKPLSDFSHPKPGEFSKYSSIRKLAEKSFRARIIYKLVLTILPLTFKGKSKDDPEVQMCLRTFADCPVEMISAQSGGFIKPSFVQKIILEANKSN